MKANQLSYWKRRCELAESVISGAWLSDMNIPPEVTLRTDAWQDFLNNVSPDESESSFESLGLFERERIDPGTTVMRVPGGYIMEYWDSVGDSIRITSCAFVPIK